MTQFFQAYFHLALEASIIILVVLAVRPMIKRYSKRIASLLWIIVLFRLLCPFTIEGPLPAFWSRWTMNDQEIIPENSVETVEGEVISYEAQVQDSRSGESRAMNDAAFEKMIRAHEAQERSDTSIRDEEVTAHVKDENLQTQITQNVTEQNAIYSEDIISRNADREEDENGGAYIEDTLRIEGKDGTAAAVMGSDASSRNEDRFSIRKTYLESIKWFQGVSGKCFINVCGVIWGFGAILFLMYGVWLYVRLCRKLEESTPTGKWHKYPVRTSDVSGVPMSFGIFRPVIYIPTYFREDSVKQIESKEKEMILQHEATHLNRRDPLWKLISLLALCMHWWNPLVWISIRCFNKDMEMACDEGVLAKIGPEQKKEYAAALLHFAQRQSGLSISAAFGESNAESRIREVLKYKKTPLWLSVVLTCLVVLLGGCLATKPSEGTENTNEAGDHTVSESPQQEQEEQPKEDSKIYGALEITEDGYYVYDSDEALQEGFCGRFRDILLGEGKISENDRFYAFNSIAHHENTIPAKRSGEHLSSWPEGISIDSNGIVTQYVAYLDYYRENGKYYLGDAEITDNSMVDSYESAILFSTFAGYTDSDLMQQDENTPTLFLDSRRTFFDAMADLWKEKDPERYKTLMDPVTAVIEVMHLHGGKGEVIARLNYDKVVKYTFEDGKAVHYQVRKRGDIWMPYYLAECTQAIRERYPEEYEDSLDAFDEGDWLTGLHQTEEVLQAATAEDLKKVTYKISSSFDSVWVGGKEGDFTILNEIPERDATLYGLYGDGGMVLRVGDRAYPIWLQWSNLRNVPELYAGDYDGDGETEYSLVVVTGTGTGISKHGLYVVELREEEAELHEFAEFMRYEELAGRLSCEYSQKGKYIRLSVDEKGEDPKVIFLNVNEDVYGEWMDAPVGLGFGDIENMKPVDDLLFYELSGGMLFSAEDAPGMPMYESEANLYCRVEYRDDGSFHIGNIEPKAYYWYDDEASEDNMAEGYAGESRICEWYADVNRDGIQDHIVTSVTFSDKNGDLTWNQRLKAGEICNVRVYDGDSDYVIWETSLAYAHAGNGMIFLCEKEGRDYLLYGGYSPGQGEWCPEYHVVVVGNDGAEYEVDGARVSASLNALEDDLPVEAMAQFTEKLNDWIKDAHLIATIDADQGWRISVTENKKENREEKFYAWEIWSGLYEAVELCVQDAQKAGSAEESFTAAKISPLKDMTNLRESLTSLNEAWKAYAGWQERQYEKAKISTELQKGKNVTTCYISHDGLPDTITVDYGDAKTDKEASILIEVRNHLGDLIWVRELNCKQGGWGYYYVTLYEGLPYLIDYEPLTVKQGITTGSLRVFSLDAAGNEQVIRDWTVNSETSENLDRDIEIFKEELERFKTRAELLVSTWNGELAVREKPSNWP